MKYTLLKQRLSNTKKIKLAFLTAGMIIVVIITYIIVSINVWEAFEKSNLSLYNSLKQQSGEALELPNDTLANKDKKQIALEALSTTIAEVDKNCTLNLLFQWQQNMGINKQRIVHCQQLKDKISKFDNDLKLIIAYLKDEKTYADVIFQSAKTKDAVTENDWASLAKQWDDAIKTMQQKSTTKSFAVTAALAIDKAQATEAAWRALIAANQAKDRAKYDQATALLAEAYQSLDEISQSAQNDLTPLVSNLENSYEQAFKT